jgi:Xaa-Pro aminopeptidase
MRHQPIDPQLFSKNRDRLIEHLPQKCLAVINANDLMPSNADGTLPYHPNSDLFYLSGIEQEESVLLLHPGASKASDRAHLFIRKPNPALLIWEGYKLNKSDARKISGISQVHWVEDFNAIFAKLARKVRAPFYLNDNEHQRADNPVETRDQRFRNSLRNRYPKRKFLRLAPHMHALRFIKEPREIDLIKQAVEVTTDTFKDVLPCIKPGVMEYEIEAHWARSFISKRCKFAYSPIIASGINACVLHYLQNDKACKKGDLLLMDVGACYANYNADLTRTVPVSGKFSRRQKQVYLAVLRVLQKSIAGATAGKEIKQWRSEAHEMMNEELVCLKLISLKDIKNQKSGKPACHKYFMHGLGHSLGLDVHDVSNGQTHLSDGAVFTVEPGIYIPEEGIGIRLEDDIVISGDQPINLMTDAPLDPNEIEERMNP